MLGGYALREGLIFIVVSHTYDQEPAYVGTDIWGVQFYADTTLNYPVADQYATTEIAYFFGQDIQGIRRVHLPPPLEAKLRLATAT